MIAVSDRRKQSPIWFGVVVAITFASGVMLSIAQEKQLSGADLFIELDQYVDKPVIVTDCEIGIADNYGPSLNCNNKHFILSTDGIDSESFQFFLKNCTGFAQPQCKLPLLVTPTGQKRGNYPVLKSVRIAR
jgi:hypothetical protein